MNILQFFGFTKLKRERPRLGRVVDVVSTTSPAIKTVMRRHENGFSVTYFRRFFAMQNGKRVDGSDSWVIQRHMEFIGAPNVDHDHSPEFHTKRENRDSKGRQL
jgi:hypothetical protein